MQPLTIAQVVPHAWEDDTEVSTYVRSLSESLAARGHRVLVVCPSRDGRAVRAARKLITTGAELGKPGEVTVLPIAEAVAPASNGERRGRRAAMPIDVSRTAEDLLGRDDIDICHVHEPFAPSLPSVALRHSRVLNVGTFHTPTERLIVTQLARKLVALIFGRLDARQATTETTAELMNRYFPAEYALAEPGTSAGGKSETAPATGSDPLIVFRDNEERGALRIVLRALRKLPEDVPWRAQIVSETGPSTTTPLRASLRDRIEFTTPKAEAQSADIVIAASTGHLPRPTQLAEAIATGAVPVVSDLPIHIDVAGPDAPRFPVSDAETLAAQLTKLVTDDTLRAKLSGALREQPSWEQVAEQCEQTYAEVLGRRHDTTGNPALWKKLQKRPLIDVDLHMHTDHSGDCATPVEHLLATARDQGLGAIAITDHNEVSGAHEAAAKAAEYGVKIIIAEEVKTESQGEVIGLFINEKIPRGMTLRETVDEIKRQGGLVYVPHPFDRMHAVPDYEHLLTIIEDIDAIEIYNPRVAIGRFNEEAERFAAKYRLVRGAGSDSHVAAGLGSVRIRMRDFDGPEEFLESLRHAEISTKSGTLLYVQALKFLETKATPAPARKARRERRVRRAERTR